MADDGLKILLLEDNPDDANRIRGEIGKAIPSFRMHTVDSKEDYTQELLSFNPNLVLSDHSLPDFNSLEALKLARSIDVNFPFTIVSSMVSPEFVTDCIHAGADDYISKNSLLRLPVAILNALKKNKIHKEKKSIESLYKKLQEAYGLIEEKNKNITESVRYALHIQQGMLPSASMLKEYFPESFVLYKPKDIVSGDFYWFRKIENRIIIAAADCTGHGVPGALMSMMGNELMNDIIIERRILNPGMILNIMRERLIKTLNINTGNENGMADGMDIALCTIDLNNHKLLFAGAYNPLWLIRENEVLKIKGNKFPVGTFPREQSGDFSCHELDIRTGDNIYLFTDGYASQFGGEQCKKFSYKRLLNFFTSNRNKTMEEQKKLLELVYNVWSVNAEQVDDVLVIGFKI